MPPALKVPLLIALLWMRVLQGQGRYIEQNGINDDPFGLLSSEMKREFPQGNIHSQSLKCVDMLMVEGQFSFRADGPQLNCAVFLMVDPDEVISLEYNNVNIDCQAGDFLKVFDGWILKGNVFPSPMDHALPISERYVDFCEGRNLNTAIRSKQNVAMILFQIHTAGNGFSLTIRHSINPFPCNMISKNPEGRFTMVIPHRQSNCSFSMIYPTEVRISNVTLGHTNDVTIPVKNCGGATDFVQLLGGNTLDPSRMLPMGEICHPFSGSAPMKISCENTVVRIVSSGRQTNRLTFEYRQLERHELEKQCK
ncbi:corticotropin-releasing factor-binding protein [Leucoraja erinacea]|uniref:corticotropin-releasing factor-binding protein n=1 Tax=Leucoraja erinaceus TaxID=7782 RepID=UPI0024561376|nr:corticotropin-releasing factor-binding protein [Leucoraja erinacea]